MIQRMGRVIRLKKDGRSARILMLYIQGTGEDPDMGGHESFLNLVRPFASTEMRTTVKSSAEVLQWLSADADVDGGLVDAFVS